MKKTSTLQDLRTEIDALDRSIIERLAQREKIVEKVLLIKKAENLPARIPERIDLVIENACRNASEIGMNPDLARAVWSAMVEWFVQHEERHLANQTCDINHKPSAAPAIDHQS
jgi:isochorismate pyruvate lyase